MAKIRRPTGKRRGRGASGKGHTGVAPPSSNHLLDGSGNILAVTVGVDQLTNA